MNLKTSIPFLLSVYLFGLPLLVPFCSAADPSLSQLSDLYEWKGISSGQLRVHYDSTSKGHYRNLESLARNLNKVLRFVEKEGKVSAEKSPDVFIAPKSAKITECHALPGSWSLLTSWSDDMATGHCPRLESALVSLLISKSTGSGMNVHPFVLEGMTSVLYRKYIASSRPEHLLNRLSPHKLLTGRAIADGNVPYPAIVEKDMVVTTEYDQLRCRSFFSFLSEQFPGLDVFVLSKASTVPLKTSSLAYSRLKSGLLKVTGHSLKELNAGWQEVLNHETPDMTSGGILQSVKSHLASLGETLNVLLPYRVFPFPQFVATSKTGEIFQYKCSFTGTNVHLMKRYRQGNSVYEKLSASRARSILDRELKKVKSAFSASTVNTLFSTRITSLNRQSPVAFEETYIIDRTSESGSQSIDCKMDYVQLRKISIKDVKVNATYDILYDVDLGQANGTERRRATFASVDGRLKLINEEVVQRTP